MKTGFTYGEGSFEVKIYKSKGYALGGRLQPFFFQIKSNRQDLDVLCRIKEYFEDVGTIGFEKNSAKFTIIKVSELIEKGIPSFEMYPLLTKNMLISNYLDKLF